ncbi:hypothetical protein DFH28DRAFT_883748 [Melampsora americana]|nr:hypothetical protein DFH28DRAFT_883748 [Melampsora americana]
MQFFLDLDLAPFEHTPPSCPSHSAPTPNVAPLLTFLPNEERTFDVYFNIWQAQVGDVAQPKGKKPKRPSGGTRQSMRKNAPAKWSNYAPKLPTKLTLGPKFCTMTTFKRRIFGSCDAKLAGVSDALHRAWFNHRITIQVFVNGLPHHKAINKKTITNATDFQKFVYAALSAPANTTMGCQILHKDPRKAELAIRALQTVTNICSDSEDSEGHDTDHSVGSVILSAGEKNLRKLMTRFEKDFKSGENVTSVANPKDPSKICLLNTARIRDWANDWADGVPGVNEVNPPMSRSGFCWIKAADYEKAKNELLGLTPPVTHSANGASGTIIHHNYYGAPFPSGPSPYPALPPLTFVPPNALPAPPAADSLRLSPPPGEAPAFEDFLAFAGISADMRKTRDALENEGISDFTRLLDRGTYTLANFRSMGIPFAQAEDLWKAVPNFIVYLRTL